MLGRPKVGTYSSCSLSLLLCTSFCTWLWIVTDTGHLQGWTCHLEWFKANIPPCLDGTCSNRKLCSLDYPIHFEHIESVASKPRLFKRLLSSFLPSRSHCNETCLDSKTCWGRTCELPRRIRSNRSSVLKQEAETSMFETASQDPERFEPHIAML